MAMNRGSEEIRIPGAAARIRTYLNHGPIHHHLPLRRLRTLFALAPCRDARAGKANPHPSFHDTACLPLCQPKSVFVIAPSGALPDVCRQSRALAPCCTPCACPLRHRRAVLAGRISRSALNLVPPLEAPASMPDGSSLHQRTTTTGSSSTAAGWLHLRWGSHSILDPCTVSACDTTAPPAPPPRRRTCPWLTLTGRP